ncbi:hypothetical protein [Ferrovibrio sp.]|uniref:hypothetical protein n=1 Tax=Ferrovibrio sp. TaxID=1917215 RepID=UPI003D0CCD54
MRRLFAILLLVILPGAARAADSLLWLKAQWTPVFVEQETGFGDAALDWLKQRLPDYRHETRFQPLPRLERLLGEQQQACTASLARNPAREARFLFSHDFLRMPGLAVVVRDDSLAAVKAHGDGQAGVDVAALLRDAALDGVINENRSYGAALDALLQPVPPERLMRLPRASTMVAMLGASRVDWVLLYPFEAAAQARALKPPPHLNMLPILGQRPVIASGIACARSAFGQRVIDQVNALIEAHPAAPWQAALNALLDDETRARMMMH